MTDEANIKSGKALPYGATELHLGSPGYSQELAVRLAESGASDEAIDAAGGPGTAGRLQEKVAATRRASGHSLVTSSPRR